MFPNVFHITVVLGITFTILAMDEDTEVNNHATTTELVVFYTLQSVLPLPAGST